MADDAAGTARATREPRRGGPSNFGSQMRLFWRGFLPLLVILGCGIGLVWILGDGEPPTDNLQPVTVVGAPAVPVATSAGPAAPDVRSTPSNRVPHNDDIGAESGVAPPAPAEHLYVDSPGG